MDTGGAKYVAGEEAVVCVTFRVAVSAQPPSEASTTITKLATSSWRLWPSQASRDAVRPGLAMVVTEADSKWGIGRVNSARIRWTIVIPEPSGQAAGEPDNL